MRTAQGFLLPEKSIESVEAYISAGGGVAINKALTCRVPKSLLRLRSPVCEVAEEGDFRPA